MITYMQIESKDEFDYNVMQHWPQAREFIDEAVEKGGRVSLSQALHLWRPLECPGACELGFMRAYLLCTGIDTLSSRHQPKWDHCLGVSGLEEVSRQREEHHRSVFV